MFKNALTPMIPNHEDEKAEFFSQPSISTYWKYFKKG